MILELVDLVVHVVDEVEVALGDLVDQVIGEHPGPLLGLAGVDCGPRVERLLAGRGLRDGDEPGLGEDEVDLLEEDPVLLGLRDREQEDADDIGVVRVDPRTWLVPVLGRRDEDARAPWGGSPGKVLLELVR